MSIKSAVLHGSPLQQGRSSLLASAPGLVLLPIALLSICFVYALVVSWRWPIVGDASIMHYVAFLMDHGMAPYREIIDINMPGAFATEWLAIHLLGPGNIAWRIFDALEMFVAIAACCVLTRSWDWRVGLFAGLVLDLAHIADGAGESGQRDWTIAVMLLLGYAFFFAALRRDRSQYMAGVAFACSAAASIKPLAAPIPLFLLAFACVVALCEQKKVLPLLLWSAAGALPVAAAFFAFLAAFHAASAFFAMVHGLLAFYTAIGNVSYVLMGKIVLGRYTTCLLVGALALGIVCKGWRDREQLLLFSGIVFGAALYFAQHKGYGQHRLTLLSFVLLFICVQSYAALNRNGHIRWAGIAILGLLLVYTLTHWVAAVRANSFDLSMQTALERDLNSLGGPALSGKIQCLEMASGCITELYNMRLMQPTGFISDFFLFNPPGQPVRPELLGLRERLMQDLLRRPPQVIVVVASNWDGAGLAYQPTQNWPQFSTWLGEHYRLAADHRNFMEGEERGSYRIYALR